MLNYKCLLKYLYFNNGIKMIFNRKHFSILFIFFSLSFIYNSTKSYYSNYYFTDYEVFNIIYKNDEYKFNKWIQSNPNVNIFNENRQTPLMIAAKLQNFSFVLRLLEAGANRYYVDVFGKTAKDYSLQAEACHNYSSSHCSDNSDGFWSSFLTDIAVGAAAGITAYSLYLLFDSEYNNYNYFDYDTTYHNYSCMKCGSSIYYPINDPKELYCNTCYQKYCYLKSIYDNHSFNYRLSDRL